MKEKFHKPSTAESIPVAFSPNAKAEKPGLVSGASKSEGLSQADG
jgi:hypothetical protein